MAIFSKPSSAAAVAGSLSTAGKAKENKQHLRAIKQRVMQLIAPRRQQPSFVTLGGRHSGPDHIVAAAPSPVDSSKVWWAEMDSEIPRRDSMFDLGEDVADRRSSISADRSWKNDDEISFLDLATEVLPSIVLAPRVSFAPETLMKPRVTFSADAMAGSRVIKGDSVYRHYPVVWGEGAVPVLPAAQQRRSCVVKGYKSKFTEDRSELSPLW